MRYIKSILENKLINFLLRRVYKFFVCAEDYCKNLDKPHRNILVGRHTYGAINSAFFLENSCDTPFINIGNFCSIASGVVFLANADHPTKFPSTYPFRTNLFNSKNFAKKNNINLDVTSKGSITIGHDVWICKNSLILSGVTIGTGAVIGAGSVVTKDIPPYAIAAGNPAKLIRYRFSDAIIEKMLQTEWWLLSDNEIESLEASFYDTNIDDFIKKVEILRLSQKLDQK